MGKNELSRIRYMCVNLNATLQLQQQLALLLYRAREYVDPT